MNKKKLVIGIIFAIIVILVIGLIVYFGNSNNNNNSNQQVEGLTLSQNENTENTKNTANMTNENSQEQNNEAETNSKALVVYFSMPETTNPNNMTRDEDNSTVVVNGEVLGNVQYVANLISEKTGSDIFRLEAKDEYPTNHEDLLERAADEQRENARPELKENKENVADYDVIFLGYPIWNNDLPPIVYTFLENNNLEGKTIIPFIVHGGSGSAGTPNSLSSMLSGSTVITNALTLSRNVVDEADSEVDAWLKEIGVE